MPISRCRIIFFPNESASPNHKSSQRLFSSPLIGPGARLEPFYHWYYILLIVALVKLWRRKSDGQKKYSIDEAQEDDELKKLTEKMGANKWRKISRAFSLKFSERSRTNK